MRQSEKIDSIYEKTIRMDKKIVRMEEHMKGFNGFINDQKKLNTENARQHRWLSCQINLFRGLAIAVGSLGGIALYFLKLTLGI